VGDASYDGSIAVAIGGEASVATNGFWSALTLATTLQLPLLFSIEDNGLGISVRGEAQTPGGNIARNLASFGNLFIRDGDGTDPAASARLLDEVVGHVRAGKGPALIRLSVPRISSHSGPDNQKGYRDDAEIARDVARDPLPRLQAHVVPAFLTQQQWGDLEQEVERDVGAALAEARARPVTDPATIKRFVYGEPLRPGDEETTGGLSSEERRVLGGSDVTSDEGPAIRFPEAVRRTIAHELEVNPKLLVFGEDVGRKGGVHLVTEGLQKRFGARRVFDTSLSEEGIVGSAVGMALADPATEQLNNCGTMRWRTNNRFAAPIVVRMPGGYGKDVGDPWHSLSSEVTWVHAIGWQVLVPSNAADAVGLLRAAMRSTNPSIFFEHRSLLMTSDGSARYPGDDYVLAPGRANRLCEGTDITVVTWGAMVHRCVAAATRFDDRVELLDLRTVAPWDRAAVLVSVRKTGRCLIVHEDTLTAGFGAEIAATVAQHAFWSLDAPVERVAVEDVPLPYHETLLAAVLPDTEQVATAIDRVLSQ
jgi:2-oxoisovalerate dehydrogenase E1 component